MMDAGLIGRKIGMTRFFAEDGTAEAATVIEAGPCVVVQKKTADKDGYEALQLGYSGGRKKAGANAPRKGHFGRAGVEPLAVLKEFRTSSPSDLEEGQELRVDLFSPGDYVDVSGISRGKGFAGVMKRWGFGGAASMTHGTHKVNRKPGAIGMSATPARVFKGTKMAGRKGAVKSVMQSLRVLGVDSDRNRLIVKGPVAGFHGSYVYIKKARKR